jgi:hypothetical protein
VWQSWIPGGAMPQMRHEKAEGWMTSTPHPELAVAGHESSLRNGLCFQDQHCLKTHHKFQSPTFYLLSSCVDNTDVAAKT